MKHCFSVTVWILFCNYFKINRTFSVLIKAQFSLNILSLLPFNVWIIDARKHITLSLSSKLQKSNSACASAANMQTQCESLFMSNKLSKIIFQWILKWAHFSSQLQFSKQLKTYVPMLFLTISCAFCSNPHDEVRLLFLVSLYLIDISTQKPVDINHMLHLYSLKLCIINQQTSSNFLP